jgi:GNAT superfamily N-acetyltransferase
MVSDEEVLAEADAWAWWPPGSTVLERERFKLAVWPAWSGRAFVFGPPSDEPGDTAGLLDEAETLAREQGAIRLTVYVRPWRWWRVLEPELAARGFEVEVESDVLSISTEPGVFQARANPGVSVRQVRDEATLRAALQVESIAFKDPMPSEERIREQALEVSTQTEGGLFVTEIDGRVVAAAGFTLAERVGRFWGAATLPEYRGRGAYTALVAARLEEARRQGATVAIVKARTGTSSPILRKLGFRHYGVEREYGKALA